MKALLKLFSNFLRLPMGKPQIWLGEVGVDGKVRGTSFPLDHKPHTHFNQGFYSDKRWRYREDSDSIFWWSWLDIADADKRAVEKWLAARGISVSKHIGNTQPIRVVGREMLGAAFSHGGGARSRFKRRVHVIEDIYESGQIENE